MPFRLMMFSELMSAVIAPTTTNLLLLYPYFDSNYAFTMQLFVPLDKIAIKSLGIISDIYTVLK